MILFPISFEDLCKELQNHTLTAGSNVVLGHGYRIKDSPLASRSRPVCNMVNQQATTKQRP